MKSKIRVIFSGGGTGGHIYPAIAIANELRRRCEDAEILFVGAKAKMEMEKVPKEGYEIKGLWISGIQRKLTWGNLSFPFKLINSLWNANKIIRQFKPDVVIGTGGFASGPTLMVANWKGIPTLVQEQNSYPGITNKLLGKKADKICVAYNNLERFFPENKIVKTGNPVRQDLLEINSKRGKGKEFFCLEKSKKVLLVLGGSLGAARINRLIEEHLGFLKGQNVQVIWQCGSLYFEKCRRYDDLAFVQVHQFIYDMDLAYATADLIISRAGASSVSELCIVGKPTIFIPSPNVAEDHQTKNAKAVSDCGAGILLREKDLDEFSEIFKDLMSDEAKRLALGNNIKKLALPMATKAIVDQVEKIIE